MGQNFPPGMWATSLVNHGNIMGIAYLLLFFVSLIIRVFHHAFTI